MNVDDDEISPSGWTTDEACGLRDPPPLADTGGHTQSDTVNVARVLPFQGASDLDMLRDALPSDAINVGAILPLNGAGIENGIRDAPGDEARRDASLSEGEDEQIVDHLRTMYRLPKVKIMYVPAVW
jgi:hypothetical protein